MRKGFFICALCILLFETSPLAAQWWNPFAPKDYEDCAENAAREANSRAALGILLTACDSKFKGRRKLGGGYTYVDPRQRQGFDIAGPNPTQRELEFIDKQYGVYLEQQRQAAAAAAEAKQRQQQAALELAQRRKIAVQFIEIASTNIECVYRSFAGCPTYSLTVGLKNKSREAISQRLPRLGIHARGAISLPNILSNQV
jgi:hypothetical protein